MSADKTRQLRKENIRLKKKITALEELLIRGLPHKEVLDAYVSFVNMVGRAEHDAIIAARDKFFTVLEIWLQSFLRRQEVQPCDQQTESGASQSDRSEASSESMSEATQTEPTLSSTPENATESGLETG